LAEVRSFPQGSSEAERIGLIVAPPHIPPRPPHTNLAFQAPKMLGILSVTLAPTPAPVQALAPALARRFGLIVAGLAALVAHRFLREPRLSSLIVPLWTRLTRTARRFERLMAKIAANRAPTPRPARPHRPTPATARATPLPTGHAWLIRALPQEAAAYAAQLEALLAEPAVADLLAASPAAARILRPLGRMLGLSAFAPKRNAPRKRSTQATSPSAAPLRAPIPPPHQDPSYRPSANWPRAHWPRPHWPPASPRRANPA
jgi:hypothetical protein